MLLLSCGTCSWGHSNSLGAIMSICPCNGTSGMLATCGSNRDPQRKDCHHPKPHSCSVTQGSEACTPHCVALSLEDYCSLRSQDSAMVPGAGLRTVWVVDIMIHIQSHPPIHRPIVLEPKLGPQLFLPQHFLNFPQPPQLVWIPGPNTDQVSTGILDMVPPAWGFPEYQLHGLFSWLPPDKCPPTYLSTPFQCPSSVYAFLLIASCHTMSFFLVICFLSTRR